MAFSTRLMACAMLSSLSPSGAIVLKRLAATTTFSNGVPKWHGASLALLS
jgi:hypothetical protein